MSSDNILRTLADQIALAVFAAFICEMHQLGDGSISTNELMARVMFRAGGLAAFMVRR